MIEYLLVYPAWLAIGIDQAQLELVTQFSAVVIECSSGEKFVHELVFFDQSIMEAVVIRLVEMCLANFLAHY